MEVEPVSEQKTVDTSKRLIFWPPLATQRYVWVQQFLERNTSIKSLTDVGCGNGRLVTWVKTVSHLEIIKGIDADRWLLDDEMDRYFRPNMMEMLLGRRDSDKPLDIMVFQGDIAVPDDRLRSDVFTMIEVIEHITPEHLVTVTRTVFGYYQPQWIIVTTPNYEFNHLLRKEGESSTKFRHWDHKFEWTRAQFVEWANQVCSAHPYQVIFDGVGHLPGESDHCGPCTQIALFTRTTPQASSMTETDLSCLDLLINKLSVEKDRPECIGDQDLKRICLMTTFRIPETKYQQENIPQYTDWNVDEIDQQVN